MGNKFIDLETDSQAEAKNRKGDRFDARINMDAADQGWNRAYDYTRATARQISFVGPDTRGTTPSTYIDGSGSSSAHTVDQGQVGLSRPPQVVTCHPYPIEQMVVEDEPVEDSYYHESRSRQRHHGSSHRSSTRGSARSHRHRETRHGEDRVEPQHHAHQRSHRSSHAGDNGCDCCSLM